MESRNITEGDLTKKSIESEKHLERLLKHTVESLMGGLCIKLLSQYMIGLPDRACLLPGAIVFFVEVKTTGKKPRKIQDYVHRKLRGLGFRVYILDSSDVLDMILDDYGFKPKYDVHTNTPH